MEDAAEDKQDRYLLGLCTLFVATIEDAKARMSQLEVVFCSQLFPAFQTKLLESRHLLQKSENLREKDLEQWKTCRAQLLSEIQELRADREAQIALLRQEVPGLFSEIQVRRDEASHCKVKLQEQTKLHKEEIEKLQQELSRLHKDLDLGEPKELSRKLLSKEHLTCVADNEPQIQQGNLIPGKLLALSEDTDLDLRNTKALQENQHPSQFSPGIRRQKLRMQSSASTDPQASCSDAKNLQSKLELKSQEKSLECFRRQPLSAEVEKEKKATRAALIKLHMLKKRYQSLRKQYTVLFRHSHLLDLQKPAGDCKNLACGEDVVADDNRTRDFSQDSSSSVEASSSESEQRTTIAEAGVHRHDQIGWLPVQKRASTGNCCTKTQKSLKTRWRNTRSRSASKGYDPHDDFLDTPQEFVLKSHKAMLSKPEADAVNDEAVTCTPNEKITLKQEQLAEEQPGGGNIPFSQITTQAPDQEADVTVHRIQNKVSNEHTGINHSTVENVDKKLFEKHDNGVQGLYRHKISKLSSSVASKAKGIPVAKQGPMYKFVEPVRRKDDREKLQGVECNHCKKFYDAVLVNEGPGAISGRCEHHDAVSRHRYRYVPPSTPEGFWNIGFDSEV